MGNLDIEGVKPFTLHHGDCIEVIRGMADNSVDSIVTDPPYELGFMGRKWDQSGVAFCTKTWEEALRVLKPGGHLLAFSGSRTYHRMTCAIEDAGFEVRDQIMWIYASGFPKSKNLDGDWQGWGTALKPAHEPVCVARKPLAGTVAANVLEFGTGALNIDGCRVDGVVTSNPLVRNAPGFSSDGLANQGETGHGRVSNGRWPANVIHDGSDQVVAAFPIASGTVAHVRGSEPSSKTANAFGEFAGRAASDQRDGGGSAARFFYCAKASKRDRDQGCDALPLVDWTVSAPNNTRSDQINTSSGKPREAQPSRNHHPTVKPTDLMRYLVRLVTPPGGLVLDPFMGSGSTGKAAMLESFRFVGIDMTADYIEIARARISHAHGAVAALQASKVPQTASLFEEEVQPC